MKKSDGKYIQVNGDQRYDCDNYILLADYHLLQFLKLRFLLESNPELQRNGRIFGGHLAWFGLAPLLLGAFDLGMLIVAVACALFQTLTMTWSIKPHYQGVHWQWCRIWTCSTIGYLNGVPLPSWVDRGYRGVLEVLRCFSRLLVGYWACIHHLPSFNSTPHELSAPSSSPS